MGAVSLNERVSGFSLNVLYISIGRLIFLISRSQWLLQFLVMSGLHPICYFLQLKSEVYLDYLKMASSIFSEHSEFFIISPE